MRRQILRGWGIVLLGRVGRSEAGQSCPDSRVSSENCSGRPLLHLTTGHILVSVMRAKWTCQRKPGCSLMEKRCIHMGFLGTSESAPADRSCRCEMTKLRKERRPWTITYGSYHRCSGAFPWKSYCKISKEPATVPVKEASSSWP